MAIVNVGFSKRLVARLFLLVGLVGFVTLSTFATQKVTLAWQASSGPGITGYNVYVGQISKQYTSKITVTLGTSATITDLTEGKTYFFAVTAFTSSGTESVPSNEVIYVAPGVFLTIKQIQLPGSGKAFLIGSTGVAPFPWALEATENFKTWTVLSRGTNSVLNVTVMPSSAGSLFFRVKRQ